MIHPTTDGATASDVFTSLVSDLTQAVTGNDSPLTAALAQAVPAATVDTSAFVAPTSFTEAIIKVSTHAPTLSPTFNPTAKPTVRALLQ